MPYQKVTMLEDLPDIDEVEDNSGKSRSNMLNPQQTQMSRRFIRNASQMLPESGMLATPMEPIIEHEPQTTTNNFIRNTPVIEVPNFVPQMQMQQPVMTCQDIFYHIEGCPLCKKFYKQDNTVYLVIIAILVLACALLLKKVLSE